MSGSSEGNVSLCHTRYRKGSALTYIKPKQERSQTTDEERKSETGVPANQVIMSPFRTFILSEGESIFESDPTVWGDVSSFDKTTSTGKGLPLTKLTSPGVTGLCE